MNTKSIEFIYDKEQIIMRTIEEIISSLNKEQMQFILTKLAENDNYNQDIIRKYSAGKKISYEYLQNELLGILNSDIESDFYNHSEDEEDERVYSGYRINETLQNLINENKEKLKDILIDLISHDK